MYFPLFLMTISVSVFDLAASQFPPTPQGVTTINSRFGNGVSISYKEPGICETTPGVRSYAGYVRLPPNILADVNLDQNYTINTFFWFFESRKDPANAPLSIWINGGPGASSMVGLLTENGPCMVNDDSNSTYLNPWSWNNEVNMLYIDQPNQVGFSWDILTNGTLNEFTGNITAEDFSESVPETNGSLYVGTFPSQNNRNTANSTANAARALWHFAQTWFQEFPFYQPSNNAISIFAESYGGKYGPAVAAFFEEQNDLISNKTINETGDSYIIHLDTLGIINGCVDILSTELSYPTMAYNNTYGIEAINQTIYQAVVDNFNRPESGCRDRVLSCRSLVDEGDPNNYGNNATVNEACIVANEYCHAEVEGAYVALSDRERFDITAIKPNSFPPNYYIGYLASASVQSALGVPLNYSELSTSVYSAFQSSGDYPRADIRGGYLADLAALLDTYSVKVALIFGDRDYACNWIGGENVSLNINSSTHSAPFAAAGYANISTNDSYVGGQVRQFNNLSFSRVFQAGHEVPSYQPETAYRIFRRAVFGQDIATGIVSTSDPSQNYSTRGPDTSFQVKNVDLGSPPPPQQCYVLKMQDTCTYEQALSVVHGNVTVRDYVLVDADQSGASANRSYASPEVIGFKGQAARGTSGAWSLLLGTLVVLMVSVFR